MSQVNVALRTMPTYHTKSESIHVFVFCPDSIGGDFVSIRSIFVDL